MIAIENLHLSHLGHLGAPPNLGGMCYVNCRTKKGSRKSCGEIEVYDIMGLQHTSFKTTDSRMAYSLYLILLFIKYNIQSNDHDRKHVDNKHTSWPNTAA